MLFLAKMAINEVFILTKEDVEAKIKDTIAHVKGLTEIHIVSSLHPTNDFNYYIEIIKSIKKTFT